MVKVGSGGVNDWVQSREKALACASQELLRVPGYAECTTNEGSFQ